MELKMKILRKIILKRLENGKTLKLGESNENIRKIIFDKIDEHYVIAAEFRTYLAQIDFSNVPFDNVDVSWVDFTGSIGVKINPQTIYDKRLNGTKCANVEFIGSDGNAASFDGVRVINTNFTGSTGAKINPQTIRHKSLFGTILKDVTFIDVNENSINYVDMFKDVIVSFADFAGSKGAKINPQIKAGSDFKILTLSTFPQKRI